MQRSKSFEMSRRYVNCDDDDSQNSTFEDDILSKLSKRNVFKDDIYDMAIKPNERFKSY